MSVFLHLGRHDKDRGARMPASVIPVGSAEKPHSSVLLVFSCTYHSANGVGLQEKAQPPQAVGRKRKAEVSALHLAAEEMRRGTGELFLRLAAGLRALVRQKEHGPDHVPFAQDRRGDLGGVAPAARR